MASNIYNMNKQTAEILQSVSALKEVHPEYPDKITVFPMAIYSTQREPYVRDANMTETDTKWKIAIDVFKKQGSITAIADEITDKFGAIGFATSVQQANQAGFSRSIITASGVVDNELRRVYQATR
ncbi:hypothetical protein [Levilactobacillus acidifarinae]|nr:hypothetical protein [Levilactobacillus acidifarinae]GEO70539.1 hypothetical protein LAC03_24490 [Levilactobacillus acidifarinae]